MVSHARSIDGINAIASNAARFAIQTSENSLRYMIIIRYRRSFKYWGKDEREVGCVAELFGVNIFIEGEISHPLLDHNERPPSSLNRTGVEI